MLNMAIIQDLPRGRQAWNWATRRPWKRSDVSDAQVICAVNDSQHPDQALEPFQLLCVIVGCPFKVALAAMLRTRRRGYVTGGITSDTARITGAGVAHVTAAQMVGVI